MIVGLLIIVTLLLVLLIGNNSKSSKSPRKIGQYENNHYVIYFHLAAMPILRWNRTGITIAGVQGMTGLANNLLYAPIDIVLNYANDIYVVEYSNHRVQKFPFGSSIGEVLAGNGTLGISASQLNNPVRIAVTSDEDLYISDNTNCRIQLWRKGNKTGTTVAGVTGEQNYRILLL